MNHLLPSSGLTATMFVLSLFSLSVGTIQSNQSAASQSSSASAKVEPAKIRSAHVRLLVSDYDREFRFFRDVLGFKSTFGKEGENYADFDCSGYTIALFKRKLMDEDLAVAEVTTRSENPGHLALIFGVSDVDSMTVRLKGLGVSFVTEPHDRKDWGIRVAHFRDPEGNLIEINHGLAHG